MAALGVLTEGIETLQQERARRGDAAAEREAAAAALAARVRPQVEDVEPAPDAVPDDDEADDDEGEEVPPDVAPDAPDAQQVQADQPQPIADVHS